MDLLSETDSSGCRQVVYRHNQKIDTIFVYFVLLPKFSIYCVISKIKSKPVFFSSQFVSNRLHWSLLVPKAIQMSYTQRNRISKWLSKYFYNYFSLNYWMR